MDDFIAQGANTRAEAAEDMTNTGATGVGVIGAEGSFAQRLHAFRQESCSQCVDMTQNAPVVPKFTASRFHSDSTFDAHSRTEDENAWQHTDPGLSVKDNAYSLRLKPEPDISEEKLLFSAQPLKEHRKDPKNKLLRPRRLKFLGFSFGVLGLAFIAVGGIYYTLVNKTPASPVTISAQAGPERILPAERGGIQFSGQDMEFLNQTHKQEPVRVAFVPLPELPKDPSELLKRPQESLKQTGENSLEAPHVPKTIKELLKARNTVRPQDVPPQPQEATGSQAFDPIKDFIRQKGNSVQKQDAQPLNLSAIRLRRDPVTIGARALIRSAQLLSDDKGMVLPAFQRADSVDLSQPETVKEVAGSETAILDGPWAPPLTPKEVTQPWGLQLGSHLSGRDARAYHAFYKGKHYALLGGLNLRVVRSENKRYHFIQVGPFPNALTAQDLCFQLKAEGLLDCFPVKGKGV